MGAEGAVNIVYRDEISDADDPDSRKAELIEQYQGAFMNPYVAASRGLIDDVIDPADTRPKIIAALERLENKRESLPPKKHGSIPL